MIDDNAVSHVLSDSISEVNESQCSLDEKYASSSEHDLSECLISDNDYSSIHKARNIEE